LDEADVALVFMDSVKTIDLTARDMLKNLEKYMKTREEEFKEDPDEALKPLKAILFLNKHDKYLEGRFRQKDEEKNPFPVQDRFRHHFPQLDDVFDKVLHGSALTGDGMQELTDQLKRYAEEREWYYAKETKTDKSQLDQAFEVIREKLFRHLNQELPYLVVQENIGWTEDKLRGILTIQEKFYIPKESQRAILHGHMKGIIFEAERDLTSLFGIKVQLRVHVVVRKDRVEPALSDAMVDFDIL
jgi:GTPase Era involved in 16S rRNA processing